MENVKVYVVADGDLNAVMEPCSQDTTAEDLCIILCKKLGISPLTRTLFALRIKGKKYFLKDNFKVLQSTKVYELRIRFKVPKLGLLQTLDEKAYNYYFQQARIDVNNDKIPEINYREHSERLLGLSLTDMYRAEQEEKLSEEDVIDDYKKFVPKIIIAKHGCYLKKVAKKSLPKIRSCGHDANKLKSVYLNGLYDLAPNHLAEEYDEIVWNVDGDMVSIKVMVAPFYPHQPGIRFYKIEERKWVHICTIESLIYLTRSGTTSLEISRRGTPIFLHFQNEQQLLSFISVCDGYYRLMVKWTFNLSKADETPSLKYLHSIKCHGPVGGAFSYRKLKEKRAKQHGCYILRQCQEHYNHYYLDHCTQNKTIQSSPIEFKGDCWVLNSSQEFGTIQELISSHQNPAGNIYLKECLPPSEYDKSQLLLCGEPQKQGMRINQTELQEILKDNKNPRCLLNKNISLFTGSQKFSAEKITSTFKALLKLDETRKVMVAYKTLQPDKHDEYLKDLMNLANKWACIQSYSIVRLYGITLSSPTALVLEYLPYGPFDEYLRNYRSSVSPLQLLKTAAELARALWDLSEAGVVHGRIRARRVLLAATDGARLSVKLAGPTIRHMYTQKDVHWIPVDFYCDMSLASQSPRGDIWAFATTLWEIFSYGLSPNKTNPVLTAKSYELGERLHRPDACPAEVWPLLADCWRRDPPRPQEIMRDINHTLYKEYVPFSKPQYETIRDFDTYGDDGATTPTDLSDVASETSRTSVNTGTSNNSINLTSGSTSVRWAPSVGVGVGVGVGTALNTPSLMQSIVSQGKTYQVILNRPIGSGTYGQVYKGTMERDNTEIEKRDVAVKKLTRQNLGQNDSLHKNFKNELEIMRSLHHVNIVEILGYSCEPDEVLIVMEYLEEGSLVDYLNAAGDTLRTPHLLKYALDIASGMDHISAKNMVHRDLAARNILVVNKTHVKISDFGLARILPKEDSEYHMQTSRLLPFDWYAPEATVEPYHFSTKSDVWSYGVTAWEIFTRCRQQVPRFNKDARHARALSFPIPDGCPNDIYRSLMCDCWELDPARRPDFISLVYKCKELLEDYKQN